MYLVCRYDYMLYTVLCCIYPSWNLHSTWKWVSPKSVWSLKDLETSMVHSPKNLYKYTKENNQFENKDGFFDICLCKTQTTVDGCHRSSPSVFTQNHSLYPYLPYLATSPNLLTEHMDICPKFHNKQHVELSVKRAMLLWVRYIEYASSILLRFTYKFFSCLGNMHVSQHALDQIASCTCRSCYVAYPVYLLTRSTPIQVDYMGVTQDCIRVACCCDACDAVRQRVVLHLTH